MTTVSPRHCRELTLGPAATESRRTLGPVAWAVLELLAETSIRRAGATVSEMSVRGLAERIGLTKDTVARALQRLQRAELVTRLETRLTDGRFGCGYYVLDVPDNVFNAAGRVSAPSLPRLTGKSSRGAEQLTLLDIADEARS